MPLRDAPVELILDGLEQKTSAKLTTPGRLTRAQNVWRDKAGQLDKRSGYAMLQPTQADGDVLPAAATRLVYAQGEVLVCGSYEAHALVDAAEQLQDSERGSVPRGVLSYGAVTAFDVVTGADTEDV